MIRFWRALAWARWRILVNSIRGGRKRDDLETLSRVGAIVGPILYAVMFIPTALMLAFGAFYGGGVVEESATATDIVVVAARVALALVTFGVLLAPLVRSLQGSQIGIARLLLLPVRRQALHFAEVFAVLTDPWVAVIIPALLALPAGMFAGGSWSVGAITLLASLLFLLVLSALGALCASTFVLVFRDRRRAELVTLVLIAVLSFSGIGISLFGEPIEEEMRAQEGVPDFNAVFAWARLFPSELYGKTLNGAAHGETTAALTNLAGLTAMAAVLFFLSGAMYRRVLDSPESGSSRRKGGAVLVRTLRVPGCGPAVSALAAVQFRTGLRTVRGKVGAFFPFALLGLIYMMVIDELTASLPEWFDVPLGPLLLMAGGAFTLLTLQPILLNQFGAEGAGLTVQFLAPVSDRQIVLGKLVAGAAISAISLALCLGAALAVAPGGHPLDWLSAALVCVASYLLFAPVATITSAYLPRTANLASIGKAGNAHPLAQLVGMLLIAVALGPPAGLYMAGSYLVGSSAAGLAFVGGWSLLVAVVSIPLTSLAAAAVTHRRENLLMVAGGR